MTSQTKCPKCGGVFEEGGLLGYGFYNIHWGSKVKKFLGFPKSARLISALRCETCG